jgi:putative RNA 2'-phosphotransferase
MTHPALIERITRSLAYMLRHQPEQFDLELDEYGYADLDDVVQALNERLGEAVEEDDVQAAVTSGDRVRYEIKSGRIRALYGHSIEVKPGEPSKPPSLLYVGVSNADAERARRYGLRAGRRRFLHLALTPEDALETGRRTARDYLVITVNALDAWEEGINFYDRKSLFLSDPIPTHFLEVGDLHSDGYGEEESQRRDGGRREFGHRDDTRREFGHRDDARRDERFGREQHERGHERGAPHPARAHAMPSRDQAIPPRDVAEEREEVVVHGEPMHSSSEPSMTEHAPSGQFEPEGQPHGSRRRRRRGGRRHEDAHATEGPAQRPADDMRHGHDDRRPPRPEFAHGGEGRDRGARSPSPARDDRREPHRPPSGGERPRFEPRHDDRRGGHRRPDDRHVGVASATHPDSARPAQRPATASAAPRENDQFGLGIFEGSAPAKPPRERTHTPPPPPPPAREPRPEKSDDSGFGAGI